jgi:hypothetical protein
MCVNSESVSNYIDESELEFRKQDAERIWTRRRIVNDLREEHDENAFDWCVSILILFQMKSMKMNCNLKSKIQKDFKHDEELWCLICCQEIESIACLTNPEWDLAKS